MITSHGVCHLQYADDTQLYIALKNEESIAKLQNCANDVYNWFAQNGLSLNPEKSEAILLGTGARLRHEQPFPFHRRIGCGHSEQCEEPAGDDKQWSDIQRTCRLHMQDIGISYPVTSPHSEVHRQRCDHVRCNRFGRSTC